MTPEQIAAAWAELAPHATPGRWFHAEDDENRNAAVVFGGNTGDPERVAVAWADDDAKLIELCHAAMPVLLAELERLRK